jgi:hypothetical protein
VEIATTMVLGIGALVVAILTKLLSDEVAALLPAISNWLVTKANLKVPLEDRPAFSKDLTAKLAYWPGKLGQIVLGIWFLFKVNGVSEIVRGVVNPPSHTDAIDRIGHACLGLTISLLGVILVPYLSELIAPAAQTTDWSRMYRDVIDTISMS